MRAPWWHPVLALMRHTLLYVTSLSLLALSAAYTSEITVLVSQVVPSKFVIHILVFLEYAAIVVEALFVLEYLFKRLRMTFKGMMQ